MGAPDAPAEEVYVLTVDGVAHTLSEPVMALLIAMDQKMMHLAMERDFYLTALRSVAPDYLATGQPGGVPAHVH